MFGESALSQVVIRRRQHGSRTFAPSANQLSRAKTGHINNRTNFEFHARNEEHQMVQVRLSLATAQPGPVSDYVSALPQSELVQWRTAALYFFN